MEKRALLCGLFIICLVAGYSTFAFSTDAGPADITLTSSDSTKKPPSVFPHKMHQETLKCGDCHHAMIDGKQAPYTEGMEIQKCESCHNPKILEGKKKGKNKLDTFKGAAHANCLDCHKDIAQKDETKKKLKSCKTCHKK